MSNERQNEKTWEKPELIVLVRSKPEEAVLLACKGSDLPITWSAHWGGCAYYSGACSACNTQPGS